MTSGLVALRPVASHHSGAQGRTKLLPSWPGHDEEKEIALDGLELSVDRVGLELFFVLNKSGSWCRKEIRT